MCLEYFSQWILWINWELKVKQNFKILYAGNKDLLINCKWGQEAKKTNFSITFSLKITAFIQTLLYIEYIVIIIKSLTLSSQINGLVSTW